MYTCDCVVLSYDSYLLTTEKTFLLFRRVSSVLSFLPLLLARSLARFCVCVCPLLFSPAKEKEREQASLARLLARARVFAAASLSLSLPVRLSSTHH